MTHKYRFIYVGGEAPTVLMKILLGKKSIASDDEEDEDDDDDEVIEAESIKEAVDKHESTSEMAEDVEDECSDLVAMVWTEGHEGWLVVREDCEGLIKVPKNVRLRKHPYLKYEDTPLWKTVEKLVGEMVVNTDIKELTPRYYIVGWLCDQLTKELKLDGKESGNGKAQA